MGYKRISEVPSMMIDYGAVKLLRYTSEQEEVEVWHIVSDYFSKARVRGVTGVEPVIPDGLSEPAKDAIQGMVESIDEGIDKFWQMVDKNIRNRNGGDHPSTTGDDTSTIGDHMSTTGQHDVQNGHNGVHIAEKLDHTSTTGQPEVNHTSTNINKIKIKENINQNNIYNEGGMGGTKSGNVTCNASNVTADINRVFTLLVQNGFDLSTDTLNQLHDAITDGIIHLRDVEDAIGLCKVQQTTDIAYLFGLIAQMHKQRASRA